MKKRFICLLALLSSFTAFSQSKIESVGSAAISVKPDIGVLTLSLRSVRPELSTSVENLNTETNKIVEQLARLKLDNYVNSTLNFSVNVNRVFSNNGKVRDSGYVASQRLLVEFKNSKENISKVLNSFSGDYSNLHFEFTFKVSEGLKETTNKTLAELATRDAIEKAEILAHAAKISLGRILEIRHGRAFDGNTQMGNGGSLNEIVIRGTNSTGFEAQNLIYTDKVLVLMELK